MLKERLGTQKLQTVVKYESVPMRNEAVPALRASVFNGEPDAYKLVQP